MRIMVTGGAGFIGAALVRRLGADRDARITVLDALHRGGRRDNLPDSPRIRLVVGDIADAYLVNSLMPGHDAIVHLAAETHVDRAIAGPAPFVATNVTGTQVLLSAAQHHAVPRFVLVSTDEVYGSIAAGAATETAPLAPGNPYAASKAAAELLALSYHRTYGLGVLVTRGANTYGPRQHPEKVVPRFVTRLLSGRPAPLYGDGRHVRAWLHVDDHCRALELVLRHGRPGETYNVGTDVELTNAELAARLIGLVGTGEIEQVADRPGHDRRYAMDSGKLRTELGWTPTVDLDDGLAATVAWYREHRDWWRA